MINQIIRTTGDDRRRKRTDWNAWDAGESQIRFGSRWCGPDGGARCIGNAEL